jgi:HK97 family phage prohead protease
MTLDRPALEYRALETPPRVDGAGNRALLTGYAVLFDELSEPLAAADEGATFCEVIRATALKNLGERRDVKCLHSHDPSKVLGSTKSGTLKLSTDTRGLRFELNPPNSPLGHDVVESVKRGDIDGVSFGFNIRESKWQRDAVPPIREILDLDLFEVSLVCWAAYSKNHVRVEERARQEARRIQASHRLQARRQAVQALQDRLAALR